MSDSPAFDEPATPRDPTRGAYHVLHVAFVLLPAIVGVDKFLDRLTQWSGYLAPQLARHSPIPVHTVMRITGVCELVVALVVALRPRIGAWLVAAWLLSIATNLVLAGGFLDIALRDVVLAASAVALARLSPRPEPRAERTSRRVRAIEHAASPT